MQGSPYLFTTSASYADELPQTALDYYRDVLLYRIYTNAQKYGTDMNTLLSSGMMGSSYDSVDAYLADANDSIKSITQQALLMQAVRSGLGATLQPGAAISHLDHQALRVIGIANPVLSRPNFLVSLSDDELTPAGLAARVILSKVMRQLVESDRWPGATLYVN